MGDAQYVCAGSITLASKILSISFFSILDLSGLCDKELSVLVGYKAISTQFDERRC